MKNVLLVLLILVSLSITAQNTGSIKGVVTDSLSKKIIPYVVVELIDTTNKKRIEFTGELGEYTFTNVPEGVYTLVFMHLGMVPIRCRDVIVIPDKTTFVSFSMAEPKWIICGGPVIRGPYNLEDNPSSTTYYGDDIRKMAVPR